MIYTDGIVNPKVAAMEACYRALGLPRPHVDTAREVYDSIDADAATLDREVRGVGEFQGCRRRTDGSLEAIMVPPGDVSPVVVDAALAAKIADDVGRLLRDVPDFVIPPMPGPACRDAQILRHALGVYLHARDTGVQPAAGSVAPPRLLASTVEARATVAARRREPEPVSTPPRMPHPDRRSPEVPQTFAACVMGVSSKKLGAMMGRSIAADTLSRERTVFDMGDFTPFVPSRSLEAVQAVFACYEKSPDDARTILKNCGKFAPAEITRMLARLDGHLKQERQ
ncbi:MAG: hypothetical protein ACT4PL_08610 [Phycisphaerales bacterium]